MSQRTRMRRLAVWLALALALLLPLVGSAAEEDDSADEYTDETEAADEADADTESAAADEAEDEGEEEEEADWSLTHHGLYVIGQGSYSFMTSKSGLEDEARNASHLGSVNSHVDDTWGYGGRVGYRVIERLALEAQVEVLNSIEIHNHQESDGLSNGTNHRSKATFFTAMGNAKGYILTDRVQPYVLAGLGYGYAELDPPSDERENRHSGFAAQVGIGTDFYVTEDIGLMSEVAYVIPTDQIEDYDNVTISFGAMLRFHGK